MHTADVANIFRETITIVSPISPPFSPDAYHGPGVGGNEATVVCWARELGNRGHKVRVYAPLDRIIQKTRTDNVEWIPIKYFDNAISTGTLISFRSVEPLLLPSSAQYRFRILFVGDRRTRNIESLRLDSCHTAWFNSQAHRKMYAKALSGDIPVAIGNCGWDPTYFDVSSAIKRVPGRCVHMSAPYRGLAHLLRWWPRVHAAVPWAELHIAGGYELWGYTENEARNLRQRDLSDLSLYDLENQGVTFHGPLRRDQYATLLRSAQLHLYPTNYEETCCIAALEAEASGVVQILSAKAALIERVDDGQSGILIHACAESQESDDAFVSASIGYLATTDGQATLELHSTNALYRSRRSSVPCVINKLEAFIRRGTET